MKFQMKNVRFLSLLIASFCYRADSTGYGIGVSCTTSEGQSGNCVTVLQCKYAMDIIQKKGIASEAAQHILRSNQCGYEGLDPKVCCPQGKVNNTDEQQTTTNQNWNNNLYSQTTTKNWNNNMYSQTTTKNWNNNLYSPTTTKNWKNNWNLQTTTNKPKYVNPLLLLPTDCGLDESDRIIGGEMTVLGEFPWMAVLEYREDDKVQTVLGCGGTLINKRYVLTAAHCILAAPSYLHLTNVRLGEHDVRNNPDCLGDYFDDKNCADPVLSVPIERQIVHQGYNSPQIYHNDIALLRLKHDVQFTKFIKPICLPTFGKTSPNYWAAGWGAIETKTSSDFKLKVSLPYVEMVSCAQKYRTKNVILGNGQICAGGRAAKDTCKGDSGGPLMKQVPVTSGPHRWVIDGVLSIGHSPCGLDGWPGVYTKVHDYVRWIVSNLEP